jgi:prepilin-type processing-associated H-X9-DG protein
MSYSATNPQGTQNATTACPNVGHPIMGVDPTGAACFWPRPLKAMPASADTVMFADYPQMQTFSSVDNRGFNTSAGTLRPYWAPFLTGTTTGDQGIGDTSPVHNRKLALSVPNLVITGTGGGNLRCTTGQINVCYCDGSVRTIVVTQGAYNVSSPKVALNFDPGSGGAGYTLPGVEGVWESTRIDPTRGP